MTSERPFTTSNVVLAFSLYLAGVPFIDENRPLFNTYDNDILKRLGYSGMTLEEGARAALSDGKKGHVEFAFRWTNELTRLLTAFNAEQKIIADGIGTVDHEAKSILGDFLGGAADEKETLMRLGCLILKSRGQFFNLWKDREDLALIRIPNAGQSTTRDGPKGAKIVSNPGYRVVSLNAGDKTKVELKV